VSAVEDTRERLNRWMQEAPGILEIVTRLVEDRDRVAEAAESAERECGRLRAELDAARAEARALRKAQAEAAEALASGIECASEALRRLRVKIPEEVSRAEPVPPSAPAPAEQPAPEAVAAPVDVAPARVGVPVLVEAAVPSPAPEPAVVESPQPPSAPAGLAGVEPDGSGATEAAEPAEQRHILLVDDDPNFRAMITEYLAGHHAYHVVTAETGEAGLERLLDVQPDLILLDVMMPGMGGIGALQRIKTLYPGLKVLMVSANEDLDIARKALVLGATDYITKPFDLDYLGAVLNIHLAAGEAGETAPEAEKAPALDGPVGAPEQPSRSWFARR
jgi:CheY-like chemotaxis protein